MKFNALGDYCIVELVEAEKNTKKIKKHDTKAYATIISVGNKCTTYPTCGDKCIIDKKKLPDESYQYLTEVEDNIFRVKEIDIISILR